MGEAAVSRPGLSWRGGSASGRVFYKRAADVSSPGRKPGTVRIRTQEGETSEMPLTIELSPGFERRLAEEAARRGQSEEEFARAVLAERLAPTAEPDRREARTPGQ